jgi:hypothetical protein
MAIAIPVGFPLHVTALHLGSAECPNRVAGFHGEKLTRESEGLTGWIASWRIIRQTSDDTGWLVRSDRSAVGVPLHAPEVHPLGWS